MQTYFLSSTGSAPAYAVGIVPAIQNLLTAVRGARGAVIWTRASHDDGPAKGYPAWYHQTSMAAALAPAAEQLRKGRSGYEIWHELQPLPDEPIVDKYRFSGFVDADLDLHRLLSDRSVDTVIVAGTLTRYCVQSNARDAMMRDYRVLVPPDVSADLSDAHHNGTLANLASMELFDLRPSEQLVRELRAT
jgi:ureidoacrylate peracid hydrolase